MITRPSFGLLLVLSLALIGCERRAGGSTTGQGAPPSPSAQALNAIPLGAPPGGVVNVARTIANPFEGQPQAIAQGKALFGSMNCVYCHGAGGAGLMGPALNTPAWRYGGSPAEVFNSIHDGRPKGMPAWGGRLPPDQIWQLVAYIESLGGTTAPTPASVTRMASSEPSTTGPQAAEQSKADSSQAGRLDADLGGGR